MANDDLDPNEDSLLWSPSLELSFFFPFTNLIIFFMMVKASQYVVLIILSVSHIAEVYKVTPVSSVTAILSTLYITFLQ